MTGEILNLIKARSAEIIDIESIQKKLVNPKKTRVKLGVDPTSPYLHLGHVVPLRMLKAFQDAGCKAVLIIGDFTAEIGDPSGVVNARRQLSQKEVKENERTYLKQVAKVLDLKRTEVRHNSEWFGKMKLRDFLELLTRFPLKRAWEREDFQQRLKAGTEVLLHEAMYPVLQAYDSIMVNADIEIGAADQKLNILAGRELQKKMGNSPQGAILMPYLLGRDGKQKMSKTGGNTIDLTDDPKTMFGKVMALPDSLIVSYAKLGAWLSPDEVAKIDKRLGRGENPRDLKIEVGKKIVENYYGPEKARDAAREFLGVFSKKELPWDMPTARISGELDPVSFVEALGVVSSRSAARRLVSQGAVELDGKRLGLEERQVPLREGSVVKVGKKQYFKVTLK